MRNLDANEQEGPRRFAEARATGATGYTSNMRMSFVSHERTRSGKSRKRLSRNWSC